MKFSRLILLFCFATLALSSCTKTSDSLPKTNADDDITYPKTDTSGINGVYIITEKGAVPIAYTNDGRLSLSGDVYYYNLKNVLDNDDNVKQKTFTQFDSDGFNKGTLSFDELVKTTENPYKMLALSGNWRLCPNIRHITYDDKTSAPENYIALISELYQTLSEGKQYTVTDAWETDLDCDGTNEAIVKATGENLCVLALLSETIGNTSLCSAFDVAAQYDITPFFADLDGNATPSLMFLSGSATKTVTVCKEKSSTPLYTVYLPIV